MFVVCRSLAVRYQVMLRTTSDAQSALTSIAIPTKSNVSLMCFFWFALATISPLESPVNTSNDCKLESDLLYPQMAALLDQPTGLKQSAANEWGRKGDSWAPDEKNLLEIRGVCRAMAIGQGSRCL